jgi:hypothetical protein
LGRSCCSIVTRPAAAAFVHPRGTRCTGAGSSCRCCCARPCCSCCCSCCCCKQRGAVLAAVSWRPLVGAGVVTCQACRCSRHSRHWCCCRWGALQQQYQLPQR